MMRLQRGHQTLPRVAWPLVWKSLINLQSSTSIYTEVSKEKIVDWLACKELLSNRKSTFVLQTLALRIFQVKSFLSAWFWNGDPTSSTLGQGGHSLDLKQGRVCAVEKTNDHYLKWTISLPIGPLLSIFPNTKSYICCIQCRILHSVTRFYRWAILS